MSNIRWLLGHVNRIKGMYSLAIAILGVSALLQLATIAVQKSIIDDVFVAGDYGKLYGLVVLFAVCFVGHLGFEILGPYVFVKNRSRLERSFTFEVLGYLYERIPIHRLHNERTAKFTTILTWEVMLLANLVAREVPMTMQALIRIVTLVLAIAYVNPILLGVLLVLCLLYVWLAHRSGPKVKAVSQEAVVERTNLQVHLDENISGTREVVSHNGGRPEDERYVGLFNRYYDKTLREGVMNNRQLLIGEAIRWSATAMILAVCGHAVLRGGMSLGTFAMVLQYTFQLLLSVQVLYGMYLMCVQQSVYADRIRGVVQEETAVPNGDIEGEVGEIEFTDVDFRYGAEGNPVFNRLNLTIPANCKIALVGESGCGKSTIVQLLMRFYEPTAGQVTLGGRPLEAIDRRLWADRVACVFQESYFFEGTIRDNLTLGQERIGDEDLMKLLSICRIDGLVGDLPDGLDTRITERGLTLSGGERQRLALVRALVRQPEILILDEATSALDYETERQVQAAIDAYRKGKTTVVVAHRLSTIRNADLIVVLQQGKVVESGTERELLAFDSAYKRFYEKQAVSV